MKNLKKFNETVIMRASRPKHDVSQEPKSIAGQLETFISKMGGLTYDAIKSKFEEILYNPETSVSKATQNKWQTVIDKVKNKMGIMQVITNLYLAAGNLGVNDSLNTMKNLKGYDQIDEFDEFDESDESTGASEFEGDIDSLWAELNTLHLLQDEGYLNGPWVTRGPNRVDYTDINDYLKSQGNEKDMFDSNEDVYTWVMNLLDSMGEISVKYKMKFK